MKTAETISANLRLARAPAYAPAWAVPLARGALVVADAALAALAFVGAFKLRQGGAILTDGGAWSAAFAPYGALLWLVAPVRVLAASYYELYRLRGEFSLFDDGIRVFKAAGLGSLLLVAAAFLYRGGFEFRAFSYSRSVFAADFALALAGLAGARLLARGAQILLRRRGVNLIPTFVVGRGEEARLCIEEMRARPALGYRVVGVIESAPADDATPDEFAGVPVVSDIAGLPEAIRAARVNEVIVTDPRISGDTLFEVMMQAGRRRGVEFRLVPSLFNLVPRKTEIDQIGAMPMIRLFREPLSDAARLVKRASDLIIAALALIVLLPLWALIALLVKLDSKGPVFYRQERVGMDGRVFLFIKFRSMHMDADDAIHREYQEKLIAGRTEEINLGDAEKPVFKLANDPRITRVGKILRRLSLDELPQLLNVLRGDMSVVGPRPPIPYEVENYELWHRKRLDMKPGITGLWQVSGRNRLSFDEMVRLDLFYIENWSLWLDVKIILKTLPVMLRGENAY
jgi:exopolysaccharide biosynthesis polyprenyl glycosylphosphotransferase